MDGSPWIDLTGQPRETTAHGILAGLRRWRQRARERRMLAKLDDRLLADIGITRVEQARECMKPFWRP